MSKGYEIRAARRARERERNLCGETLAEYHARENPARAAPGADIPRVRCHATHDLFGPVFEHPAARQFNMGFLLGWRRRG
jgi:hypothetical protein